MRRKPAFYLVLDVEATCSEDDSLPRAEREIIEIGAVILDGNSYEFIDEYQTFIRPIRHPKLTPFCTDLTSIRQVDVQFADPFDKAMLKFRGWMRSFPHSLFCSWGKYDRVQFERDCRYHRVKYPFGNAHLNLKKVYTRRYNVKSSVGLSTAMRWAHLRIQGRPHRGIDDARNLARLLPYILD